jgi:hypothetical protein
MHVSWMEAQYFYSILEHYLSVLDQGYTCDGGSNTLNWPALFSLKFTKSLFSLVKELPIFEYKCAYVKLSLSQAWEDGIL